ncbi:MAG: glycosyltransferase family 4 protein [Cyclobacteriaceae bacterium]
MAKNRIVYIISDINKSLEFEWLIDEWKSERYEISFILINGDESVLKSHIEAKMLICQTVKSSRLFDLKGILRLRKILKKLRPDIVHCHLLKASFQGLVAAKLAGIHVRIHTRHHGSFHHSYHPKGVLLDRLINHLSSHVVAISQNVKEILVEKEGVQAKKINIIHHGFKLELFHKPKLEDVNLLRAKYQIGDHYPVIGVISRFFELKGIQYTIDAFAEVLKDHPNALLIMANARGPYSVEIDTCLRDMPNENYLQIPFEEDIFSLYQLFDVHIHVPIDQNVEAFGQTYVEALAAGIPSIFTLSGVAREFIKNNENALVVDFRQSYQIYQSIRQLLSSEDLRKRLVQNGEKSIEPFKFSNMMDQLEKLYDEC